MANSDFHPPVKEISFISRIKSCPSYLMTNRNLLLLKMSFFLIFTVWITSLPYATLLSKKMVSPERVAITYSSIPAASILGPIFTGFLADKIGNYKIMLIVCVLLSGFSQWSIVWLPYDYENFLKDTTQLSNYSKNDSNGSHSIELHAVESFSSNTFTFPLLFFLRTLSFFLMDSVNILLDSCALVLCKKHNGNFGKQKMFASLAIAVFPVISGVLIDTISNYRGFRDYSVTFYIALGCAFIAAWTIYKMDIDEQIQNKKTWIKTAKTVMSMADVTVFFLVQIVHGTCWGWHMNFFSVYFDMDLEASNSTIFGISMSIGGTSAMIILFAARPLLARFGAANVLSISLMAYGVKFISYHFLQNPWLAFLVEGFDGLCGFLGLLAGNIYCAENAPPGMLASFSGIFYSAVFGIGRTLGTTVGGYIASQWNTRFTFLVFSILSGSTSILYFLSYHLYLKKIENTRRDCKKLAGKDNQAAMREDEATTSDSKTAPNQAENPSLQQP